MTLPEMAPIDGSRSILVVSAQIIGDGRPAGVRRFVLAGDEDLGGELLGEERGKGGEHFGSRWGLGVVRRQSYPRW